MSNTTHRAAIGATVLIASNLVTKLFDLALLALLSRLLTPSDFGLVAAAMAPVLIVQTVMEIPVGAAVLRLPVIEPKHVDTAFTIGLLRGMIVMTALVCLALPYSAFTGDPRLFPLLLALSFSPAARAIQSPGLLHLARKLQYGRSAAIEMIAKLAGGTAGLLHAFWIPSYWSLVTSTITTSLMLGALSYSIAPYRPRITLAAWRDLSAVTGWGLLTQSLNAVAWQIDKLVLGRYVSKDSLGRFSVAADIAALPFQAMVVPLTRPFLPALSNAHHDGRDLQVAYAKSNAAVLAVVGPILVVIATFSEDILRLLVGPQWTSSSYLLTWLALAGLPSLTIAAFPALATVLNRSSLQALFGLVDAAIRIPLAIAACIFYGVDGAVASRVAGSMIGAAIVFGITRISCGFSLRKLCLPLMRVAGCLAVAYATGALFLFEQPSWVASLPLVLRTALGITLTGLAYVVALVASWLAAGRPDGIESLLVVLMRKAVAKLRGKTSPTLWG